MVEAYVECKLAGSPPMTLEQFSKAFWGKYIRCSMRERLRDDFTDLHHGSMTMLENKASFLELSRHTTMIMPTEHKRVRQ